MLLAKDFCRSVEAVLLWGAVVQHSIDVMVTFGVGLAPNPFPLLSRHDCLQRYTNLEFSLSLSLSLSPSRNDPVSQNLPCRFLTSSNCKLVA